MICITQTYFELLIEPHITALQAYCNRLTGNKVDGEDLFQTTLEKAYRASLNKEVIERSYLYRIAKNTWIDSIRKKTVDHIPLVNENQAYKYDHDLHIREAFEVMSDHLTIRQAVLILMIDIFRFTAKETAFLIGSTEGAVKEALKRARLRLNRISVASDAHAPKMNVNKQTESMTQELMELFIQAFRSGNIQQIYSSYKQLRHSGLDVSRVWMQTEYIYFDFQDPNGHIMRITSKKINP